MKINVVLPASGKIASRTQKRLKKASAPFVSHIPLSHLFASCFVSFACALDSIRSEINIFLETAHIPVHEADYHYSAASVSEYGPCPCGVL